MLGFFRFVLSFRISHFIGMLSGLICEKTGHNWAKKMIDLASAHIDSDFFTQHSSLAW